MKSALTLIKLGGAVITDKTLPRTLRSEVLHRLTSEIARAQKVTGKTFIIGNGAGSFAHAPAAKYKTMDGFVDEGSRLGMALTQDEAAQLNRLVVGSLISEGVPALTFAPSNSVITHDRRLVNIQTEVLEEYLHQGMIPVVYGDVIVDRGQGCTIWSTDTVLAQFAKKLMEREWKIERILHVTEAEGVWKNEAKEIYTEIRPHMRDEVKLRMVDTRGTDVTGGMWHKIQTALDLAEQGIPTQILSGVIPNNLYRTLAENAIVGTRITV